MPDAINRRPIRRGDEGPAVVVWQRLLAAKGYALAVDGDFGPKTENATKAAQSWAGVKMTGQVNAATWNAVAKKTRTMRPVTTTVNAAKVAVGKTPKIIDARPGRGGFPDGPGTWRNRGVPHGKLGHHTGGPGSFVADARFHTQSSYLTAGGAPALAYHVGVDLDGTWFVFNMPDDLTWHCDGGQNQRWLGVVVRGHTDTTRMPLVQRRSLWVLWRRLRDGTFKPFKGEPAWPRLVPSTTHQHVSSTSCPGAVGEKFYRGISGATFEQKP